MWNILGIPETTDEDAIKAAYREKLIQCNPEENPEGFKELREAYEAACAWAQKAKKEKGPVEQWMFDVEQVYNNFYARIDEDEWDELFENDVCTDLDTENEARNQIVSFAMNHFCIPAFVWKKIWDVFEFDENREIIASQLTNDFVTYIEFRGKNNDYFDYQLFEGPMDADYDEYIKNILTMKMYIDDSNYKEVEKLIRKVEASPISHPYVKLEIARYYLKTGSDAWKPYLEELETELYEDEGVEDFKAEVYMKEERYEDALAILEKYTDLNQRENGVATQPIRHLVECLYQVGRYKDAKDICLDVLESKIPDEIICNQLVLINQKLIEIWKDDPEKKMDLAWSYYQNQKFQDCLNVIRTMKPEGDWEFDYYNLLARVLLETKDYAEGYETTKIWIRNIEQLKGDEKDYERKSRRYGYAHFIASMFCLELGIEDKANEYLARAIELDHDQMDLLMYRERRMESFLHNKRYEDCIHEANVTLEYSEYFYPAYIYRQEANYKMGRIQQMMDDFYRANALAPNQAKQYVTVLKMMLEYGGVSEMKQILDLGKKNGVNAPEFDFYDLEYRRCHSTDEDEMVDIARQMEDISGQLTEQKADICYRIALIYDRLSNETPEEFDEKAFEYAKKAVQQKDEEMLPQYFWLLGDIYQKQDENEKAVKCYQRVVEMNPGLYDAYIDMGNAYESLNQKDRAILAFEHAATLKTNHPYVHNKLMNLYLEQFTKERKREDFSKAIYHADQQLEITENAYYYRERAYVYIEDMQLDRALEDIQASFALAPDDLYALSSMGYIYRLLGDYKSAINYYKLAERHAETDGQKFSLYHWWAPIYTRDGQFAKAIQCLLRCLEIDPEATALYDEIADNYMRLCQYDKAIEWYEKALKQEEEIKPMIMMDLARAYLRNGNTIRELAVVKQAELSAKDNVMALCAIGEYYLEDKNDLHKAYKYYYQACDETSEEPYVRIVEIYAKMGKMEDAHKMCRMAEKMINRLYGSMSHYIAKKERQKFIYYNMALMYYYSGEMQKAAEFLKQMKESYMCYFCTHATCYEEKLLDVLFLQNRQRYNEALAIIQDILSEDPNISRVHFAKKEIEEKSK